MMNKANNEERLNNTMEEKYMAQSILPRQSIMDILNTSKKESLSQEEIEEKLKELHNLDDVLDKLMTITEKRLEMERKTIESKQTELKDTEIDRELNSKSNNLLFTSQELNANIEDNTSLLIKSILESEVVIEEEYGNLLSEKLNIIKQNISIHYKCIEKFEKDLIRYKKKKYYISMEIYNIKNRLNNLLK